MSVRLPFRDPRTVAREIPGFFDTMFPHLTPGIVMSLNGEAYSLRGCQDVPKKLVQECTLQHAMLFEISVAAGEQLLIGGGRVDISRAMEVAIRRQRRHFDAKLPDGIDGADVEVVELVAANVSSMIKQLAHGREVRLAPVIPGFQWIASGNGDFASGAELIEIKCSYGNFGASDYRQILMYWLLSYASAVEGHGIEWEKCFLVNPRSNRVVEVMFGEIVELLGGGRSKVELLELFRSLVSDHYEKLVNW